MDPRISILSRQKKVGSYPLQEVASIKPAAPPLLANPFGRLTLMLKLVLWASSDHNEIILIELEFRCYSCSAEHTYCTLTYNSCVREVRRVRPFQIAA
jgi:hypothetical protein